MQEFTEDLKTADTVDGAIARALKEARRYGLTYIAAHESPNLHRSTEADILYAGLPKDWTDYYLEQDFLNADPIVKAAADALVPFQWAQVTSRRDMQTDEARVMGESAEAGLLSGLLVPIDCAGPAKGFVSFAGGDSEIPRSAELDLHLIGIHLHHRLKVLNGGKSKDGGCVRLTPQEGECLLWISRGKSDWEIGEILSISERTARAHALSIKRKVGARTRVQAVVDAIQMGLIDP